MLDNVSSSSTSKEFKWEIVKSADIYLCFQIYFLYDNAQSQEYAG